MEIKYSLLVGTRSLFTLAAHPCLCLNTFSVKPFPPSRIYLTVQFARVLRNSLHNFKFALLGVDMGVKETIKCRPRINENFKSFLVP